jgi:hypothetical protein
VVLSRILGGRWHTNCYSARMGILDLNADGRAIVEYLKAWSGTFISGREIARRAGGKRRYAEDRFWAVPVLAKLVEEGILEEDESGHFRLRQEQDKKSKASLNRHVSPQMLRILKSSGREFQTFDLGEIEEPPSIPTYPEHLLSASKKGQKPPPKEG